MEEIVQKEVSMEGLIFTKRDIYGDRRAVLRKHTQRGCTIREEEATSGEDVYTYTGDIQKERTQKHRMCYMGYKAKDREVSTQEFIPTPRKVCDIFHQ